MWFVRLLSTFISFSHEGPQDNIRVYENVKGRDAPIANFAADRRNPYLMQLADPVMSDPTVKNTYIYN